MLRIKTHLVGGIFTVLISAVMLILMPFQIDDSAAIDTGQLSASFVPSIVLYLMLGLGVILIVQSLFLKTEHVVELEIAKLRDVGIFTLILLVAVLLFYFLGFLIAMFAMCALIFWRLKCREKLYYIITAALILIVYFSFTMALNVPLP